MLLAVPPCESSLDLPDLGPGKSSPTSLSHRVQKIVLYICVSFAASHTGLSLPYSSPSSNSVSLCTTTLVTDMSGCCSLASLMAWASACRVRREHGEQRKRFFFGVAMHEHTHHLRSSLQQKAMLSLLYLRKQEDMKWPPCSF